ncbi:EH signature domain-containing protein [Asticcacaulis sp. AC460]|uniref:EH signature domain-containing protein n=1 Tax=Asticcacaulis sp. AC460 TaxID=1282360 RepID=UPI00138AB811|nr:EH signature domain-containing protein [Asticcacaulis sp. AC460]
MDGEGVSAEPENVDALQRRLLASLETGEGLSGRDLREGARVLFHPPLQPGRDETFLRHFVALVEKQHRRSALFGLIDAYIDRFSPDHAEISVLARELKALTAQWPWREDDVWRLRDKAFFDVDQVAGQIAKHVLHDDLAPNRTMEDAGLDTALRQKGGLALAAFVCACREVATKKGAVAGRMQSRLIDWARLDDSPLNYPAAWRDYAEALLAPWSQAEPSEAHKSLVIEAVFAYGGDPRFSTGRWNQASAEARSVLNSWLARASFEQFFAIVDRMDMAGRGDMWRDRKTFWSQYLDQVSKAWVVFGEDGAFIAKQISRQSGDASFLNFGLHDARSGRTKQHTALIMAIGELTVVEWSHNGSWNIWLTSDRTAPKFYEKNYRCYRIMNAPALGEHKGCGSHDQPGRWKGKIANIIRHFTGIGWR